MPVCQLCSVAESRYKCPTCFIPYCSLACYRPHKATHEQPHNSNNNNNNNSNSNSGGSGSSNNNNNNNVHTIDSPVPPPHPPTAPTPASPRLAAHQAAALAPSLAGDKNPAAYLVDNSISISNSNNNTLPPPPQTQTQIQTQTARNPTTTPTTARYSPLLSDPYILPFLKANPSLHSLLYQVFLCTLQPPLPPPPLPSPPPPHPHHSASSSSSSSAQPNPYRITKRVSSRHMWTPEVGVAKGVKRLGRTRDKALAKGGSGGTLEEFVLMVLKCLGGGDGGGGGEGKPHGGGDAESAAGEGGPSAVV